LANRLEQFHEALLARAELFLQEHRAPVNDWDAFAAGVATGWVDALHCGRPECEDDIKAQTSATPRCIPSAGPPDEGICVRCGQPSAWGKRVIFAKAY
jgi:prolyl-tRNA synthetase